MRIDPTHLGHYGSQSIAGAGFDLWPHDSGQGAFMLAFFPGPVWLEGGEAQFNPLTRATDMALGWRDADGVMHRCGQVRLTAGADGAIVASFVIENGPPGISSFSDTFRRLIGNGAPITPPLHPQPPEPEPPAPPVEPVQPVLPPGVVGQLNVIPTSWAQLFGGEFGQIGWRLQPPARLHNRPDGSCDVLSIAFRAPSVASGFDHGRFTQPIDGGGTLLLWYSRPGEDLLALARADRRAWINGTDITWELAGAPGSSQDRYQFEPGAIYCLNAAFVAPKLIPHGIVEPTNPHGGEFALTATQQA